MIRMITISDMSWGSSQTSDVTGPNRTEARRNPLLMPSGTRFETGGRISSRREGHSG